MKSLIHVLRLIFEPSGRNVMLMLQPQRWQVTYPDGKKSQGFAYDVACDYASIFGGTVNLYTK